MSANELIDSLKKDKGLQKVLDDVKVTLLSDPESPCIVTDFLSTGCLVLDWAIGGGLPVGRIVEIHGDYSTGKTLLASQVAAVTQAAGGVVLYLDSESAVSIDMMEEVGVDPDKMIYVAPETVEQVFHVMEETIRKKKEISKDDPLLIVWDSIAATTAKGEQDADYGKSGGIAIHARLISQGLRKITRQISKSKTTCLFLNQTRTKIGVVFGDNVATPGGKALDFYSSVRIRLKKSSYLKSGSDRVGANTIAVVIKNRIAKPYREVTLPIYFGHGVSDALAAYEWLSDRNFLDITGGWASMELGGEEQKFQKNGNWLDVFDENYDEISKIITEYDV